MRVFQAVHNSESLDHSTGSFPTTVSVGAWRDRQLTDKNTKSYERKCAGAFQCSFCARVSSDTGSLYTVFVSANSLSFYNRWLPVKATCHQCSITFSKYSFILSSVVTTSSVLCLILCHPRVQRLIGKALSSMLEIVMER